MKKTPIIYCMQKITAISKYSNLSLLSCLISYFKKSTDSGVGALKVFMCGFFFKYNFFVTLGKEDTPIILTCEASQLNIKTLTKLQVQTER